MISKEMSLLYFGLDVQILPILKLESQNLTSAQCTVYTEQEGVEGLHVKLWDSSLE
jgi:hypothetical protein